MNYANFTNSTNCTVILMNEGSLKYFERDTSCLSMTDNDALFITRLLWGVIRDLTILADIEPVFFYRFSAFK